MPAANKSAAEQCGFRGSDRLQTGTRSAVISETVRVVKMGTRVQWLFGKNVHGKPAQELSLT